MIRHATSFDWAAMIEELILDGMTRSEINGGMLTDKMLSHYRRGVQPLHWRGERIITIWCARLGRERGQAPTRDVDRGTRVDRRPDAGPQVQSLPRWPVAAQSVPMRKKAKREKVEA